MKVFYGYSKLTEKAIKKVEFAIYFENSSHNPVKSENWVKQRMHVVHTRYQTESERKDSVLSNRNFTKYGYFIDERPYYGDIEKALLQNFLADANHVSLEERELVMSKMRSSYFEIFKRKKDRQLSLHF